MISHDDILIHMLFHSFLLCLQVYARKERRDNDVHEDVRAHTKWMKTTGTRESVQQKFRFTYIENCTSSAEARIAEASGFAGTGL